MHKKLASEFCGFAAFHAERLRLSVKVALLLQSRLSASFDAEANSLDLRFDSAYGKPEAFRTEGGKAAIQNSDFLCKAGRNITPNLQRIPINLSKISAHFRRRRRIVSE